MTLVKAEMAFYHDAVGTRAHGEVFEIKNAQVCADLEQAGYVKKVEGEEAQAHQQQQQLQQEVGKVNALANEAVSLAHHAQNQEANAHQMKVSQMRQQSQQSQQSPRVKQMNEAQNVKKADK